MKLKTRTTYKLVGSDYSAQEPRLTAHLGNEEAMRQAYAEGKDLYCVIASKVFNNRYEDNLEFYPEGEIIELDGKQVVCGHKTHLNKEGKERRAVSKQILLAITYGMAPSTLAKRLGKTNQEAQEIFDSFFKSFPKVEELIKNSKEFLRTHGYVEDWAGRRRHLTDYFLNPYEAAYKNEEELIAKTFNPILGCENRPLMDNVLSSWISRAKMTRNNKEFEQLAKEANEQGVILTANSGRIAQAERQCLNSRIQGCLGYDELIYTDRGVVKIGSMANQQVNVWDGSAWSSALVLPSGKKQKCILTTKTGQKIICSPDHRFLVVNTAGNEKFKKLSEIVKQERLIVSPSAPVIANKVSFRSLFGLSYEGPANKHNYSFDDIKDDYIRGQVLGRIASDGSYIRRLDGGNNIYLFVAEHEAELLEFFEKNLPFEYQISCEQKKNQKVYRLIITSTTLVKECLALDIKNQIPECFFANTELLRGFISGFFDGDGSASNECIRLDFGTQRDFTKIIKQMQEALSIFGIRSTTAAYKDRYRVNIRKFEANLFAERIGFITKNKQNKALAIKTTHTNKSFNNKVVVGIRSIEFTDEYIDMYDVCNTERGYFVVNGIVTHNSAASLTKLAMIQIHNSQELKDLDAKLVLTIHDEVILECPALYADEVSEILPRIMIEAAAPYISVGMKCDPAVESRWAVGEYTVAVQSEFTKYAEKGCTREEAFAKLYANHPELPEEAIYRTITEGIDLEF